MATAEIITIGTEILLGELIDTNAPYIARQLRDLGIDIYRKTSVGDNKDRIAQAIHQALVESEFVITTGGLGPTVDDPTREAVALAMGVQTEYLPELWEQIVTRFQRFNRQPTDNNRRQAYIPQGALPIENPVGTAPAFIYETEKFAIFSLPGVPYEMEYLMEHEVVPYIRRRFPESGTIKTRTLHTAGVGESQIDDLISDLETLSNPTVGLAAHSGQVDVRITAKAVNKINAEKLIADIEAILRERLGDWIFGADEETLESNVLNRLEDHNLKLAVIEYGLGGELLGKLAATGGPFVGGEILTSPPEPDELSQHVDSCRLAKHADIGLGVSLIPRENKQDIYIIAMSQHDVKELSRPYGGPPILAKRWAINHSLNLLRQF